MDLQSENHEITLRKAEAWMGMPGIEGVALSEVEGTPCILVFNSLPAVQYQGSIPSELDGLAVVFQDTSTIMALDELGLQD